MGSYNCIAGCQDCDTSTGCCNDDFDAGLASGPDNCTVPTTGTTSATGSASSSGGAASTSSLLSIFGGLGSIASSLISSTQTPSTASLSSTPTTAQPYPVVVNGKVVGYSSVQAAASTTSGAATSGFNITDLILFLLIAFGIYWVVEKR